MKTDILIFAALTLATILILAFTAENSTLDIQLHDTYLVIDKFSLIVLIIGPLAFVLFFLLGLARKFKAPLTNIGLIIGLILVSLIFFRAAQLQMSFQEQIDSSVLRLPKVDRERFMDEMNYKMILTGALFGVCMLGIGWTGFRTYRLLSKDNSTTSKFS